MYAWAQQVIQGSDGAFYMYYPGMKARPGDKQRRSGTGVASSASVLGPFNDALGHPLLPCGDDPTVFRDDNGIVYLCGNCGGGGALCAQLAPNMTALATTPVMVRLPQWFEAPWLSKWKGVYYLSYMCSGDPGHGKGDFNRACPQHRRPPAPSSPPLPPTPAARFWVGHLLRQLCGSAVHPSGPLCVSGLAHVVPPGQLRRRARRWGLLASKFYVGRQQPPGHL